MEGDFVGNKCRACLKESDKMNPLTMIVKGYLPKSTFGELLRNSAILESTADYEYLMPQNICIPCCQELRRASTFIQQTQSCNKKLLDLINKHLSGSLGEQVGTQSVVAVQLENVTDKNGIQKGTNCERNDSNDWPIEYSTSCENMQNVTCFQIRTEDYVEHINVVEVSNDKNILQNSASNKTQTNCSEESLIERFEILEHTTEMENYANSPNVYSSVLESDETISASEQQTEQSQTYNNNENGHGNGNKKPRKRKQCKNFSWFHCSACPRKFSHEHHYIYHLKKEHDISIGKKQKPENVYPKLKCDLCDHQAINILRLRYHKRLKHGNDAEKFHCELCSFKHFHKSVMETHILRVHNKFRKKN